MIARVETSTPIDPAVLMANPFADLIERLDRLSEHLGEVADDIRLAIRLAAIDPQMALTKARQVLERIVHDVYARSVGEPPGHRSLNELTLRLVKDGHLPPRVAAYANFVRDLGNTATHPHGQRLTREDVSRSIGQLLVIVDWYDDRAVGREARGEETMAGRKLGAEVFLDALGPHLEDVFVPVDRLLLLYRECAPPGWEPPPASHEPAPMLVRCVEGLARAPRQGADGLFPLFRFVRGLIDGLDAEAASTLESWLLDALGSLGGDLDEVARLRACLDRAASPAQALAADCYLLVQVSPRLCEAGRYGVKAWLFGTEEPACLLAGETAMALDQVRECLDELRLELYRRVPDPERARVELLLPRELLCLEVDQWRVEVDFLEAIPLGVEHRLVVRSLERASRPKAALALHARGKALGRKLAERCRVDDGPGGEARWISGDQRGGPGLYTTLRDAQAVVGAALGEAPHPSPRDPAVDVLNTLFAAGLPVVVWSRRSGLGRELLLDLLGHEPFGRLPDRVWELRKQAVNSEDEGHIGRHLTLLWDDPTRPSPDFEAGHRLRAPSRE